MIYRCNYGDRKGQIVIISSKGAYWPKDGLRVTTASEEGMAGFLKNNPDKYICINIKAYIELL